MFVSPNTTTNCAFSACEISINRDKYKWLLEKGEKRLVQRSADLKHRVNPSNKKRTHMDDLQDIADYKKTEIVLYNNVFHKIRRFVPSGEVGKKASRKLNRRPIEIQLRETASWRSCAVLRLTSLGKLRSSWLNLKVKVELFK